MSPNGGPAGDRESGETGDRRGILRRLTGAVTGRMVEAIDPGQVVEQIDVDSVVERIDVDHLLERVDVDRLLDRVDVNRLLDRVDVNRLLDRVDGDRLLDRVDVNAIVDRVDVEEVVRRSGIPDIVADSTGRLAGSALDLARRQLAGLDVVVHRTVTRVLGRDPSQQPVAPPRLTAGPPT